MAIRQILLSMADSAAGRTCARIAAQLAARDGAHLIGRHYSFERRDQGPGAAYAPTREVLAARGHKPDPDVVAPEDATAKDARRLFEEAAAAAGAQASFEARRAGDRPLWACLQDEARCCDLTVTGKPADSAEERQTVAQLVEESGGPLLLVPESAQQTPGSGHVAIGWNDSREAARAVRDALPFIERAGRVSIVIVQSKNALERSAERLQALLEAHGARCEIRAERSELKPADALVSRAEHLGADMIVAGAFGRTRVREMISGGATTAKLVQQTTLPLLMAQ